jgi:putative resolvase
MDIQIYDIADFAKMIGVSVKTLQRWDRKGILKAYRTPTNRRYYTHAQYLEYRKQEQPHDQ